MLVNCFICISATRLTSCSAIQVDEEEFLMVAIVTAGCPSVHCTFSIKRQKQNFWTTTEFLYYHKQHIPEFLERPLSFVLIKITLSRITGACTTVRHDTKHRVQYFWNVHSSSVGSKKTGPEFLDHNRISVLP
jgi:hypothetical protein